MLLYGTMEDLRDSDMSTTHRLEVVYLHAIYEKPILNHKKVTARTRFVTDAGTDLTSRSKFKVKGHQQWYATHRLEVVYLHAKYEKPVLWTHFLIRLCYPPIFGRFSVESLVLLGIGIFIWRKVRLNKVLYMKFPKSLHILPLLFLNAQNCFNSPFQILSHMAEIKI
jgi:hypothetical protein